MNATRNVLFVGIMLILGSVFFGNPERAVASQKGMVSFTIDDGEDTTYDIVYPIIDRFRYRATLYITTDWMNIRNHLTWSELRTLEREGWEIGNHTANHDYLTLKKFSKKKIRKDFRRSMAAFAKNGINTEKIKSFAPPYGKMNKKLLAVVKEFGFTSVRWAWPKKDHLNSREDFDTFGIEAINLKRPIKLEDVKSHIDRAAEENKWLVFLTHRVVNGKPKKGQFNSAQLNEILEYVDEYVRKGDLEVVTVGEGGSAMNSAR